MTFSSHSYQYNVRSEVMSRPYLNLLFQWLAKPPPPPLLQYYSLNMTVLFLVFNLQMYRQVQLIQHVLQIILAILFNQLQYYISIYHSFFISTQKYMYIQLYRLLTRFGIEIIQMLR